MGLFDRFRRQRQDEPEHAAPGLFTARSGTLPPTLVPPATEEREPDPDLWDRPTADETVTPPAVAAVEELAPPQDADAGAVTPVPPVDLPAPTHAIDDGAALWDDGGWDEETAPAQPGGGAAGPLEGSTAEDPLFGAHAGVAAEPPPAPSEPVRPLFDPPEVATEPEPTELTGRAPDEDHAPSATVDEEGRTMRVHDGRLDTRPGPIKMTPSEAVALAQEGPRALRRRTHPDH